jgi:hypothetical protein
MGVIDPSNSSAGERDNGRHARAPGWLELQFDDLALAAAVEGEILEKEQSTGHTLHMMITIVPKL